MDSSRAWPALLLSATTGAALAGVLYWLHQTHVLPGGDDVPYRTGPHSVQIWAWSLGLGLAVTVTLTALAYRLAGPDGAGWTVGLSVLAYPAVAVSGPYLIDGPVSGPARAVAGCVGVGLGVLLVSRVDGRPPWAALGLLMLGVVVLVPSAPPWLVVGLAGLAVGAALTRLARHTGPALGAVGVGVAAWLYDVRALGPIVDVDPPRPVLVAWLLAGVVTLFAVQSRVPASRLVERVQDPRLG